MKFRQIYILIAVVVISGCAGTPDRRGVPEYGVLTYGEIAKISAGANTGFPDERYRSEIEYVSSLPKGDRGFTMVESLGWSYIKLGDYKKAIEAGVELREKSEFYASMSYKLIATAYRMLSMPEECITSALKAINISGYETKGTFYYSLDSASQCYLMLGYYDASLANLALAQNSLYMYSDLMTKNLDYIYTRRYAEANKINETLYNHYGIKTWEFGFKPSALLYYGGGNIGVNGYTRGNEFPLFYGFELDEDNKSNICTITRVFPNSPAAKAGIMPGDEVKSYNGMRCGKGSRNDFFFSPLALPKKPAEVTFVSDKDGKKTVQLDFTPFPSPMAEYYALRLMMRYGADSNISQLQSLETPDALMSMVTAWDNGSPLVKLAKGLYLIHNNKPDEALAVLEMPISELDRIPWYEHIRLVRALAYLQKGKLAAAAVEYSAVHKEILSSPPVKATYDELVAASKPLKNQVFTVANKAEVSGKYNVALNGYGNLLLMSFTAEERKENLRRLSRLLMKLPVPPALDSASIEYIRAAGEHMKAVQPRMAALDLQTAIIASPYSARLYREMALTLEASGDFARAASYAEDYLTLAPQAPDADTMRENIARWSAQRG